MDRKEWLKEFIKRMDEQIWYRLVRVWADGDDGTLWEPGDREPAWDVVADCVGPVWLSFTCKVPPANFDLPNTAEVMICPDCTGVEIVANYTLSDWDGMDPVDFVLKCMKEAGLG